MSKLQLILLGRFECLLSSGTRISLSMRKAEVLLAYLALTPGLRHPRERLINLLWSDRSDEQARNSLRQCLSAIKKSLGEAADLVLQVDRTTVCLSPDLIEVDVHEFERLAAEGDYESLTTAADLYQGEFLEGISIRDPASQEWLENERSRFKRQFIEILSNLADTQLISHDYGHAIRSAERLVKQDPLGESGWRLLMRSYQESGDRNHALQAFKRCQQSLRDELDIEPEIATIELRDQIAGGETSPAPGPSAPVKKPPVDSTAPTEHSIAVLPFDNLSGDPEQEYFSDGITDSIILNLSLFPGLQVKSRNSSFAFKQQIKSLGEISKELEVDYIVEGSIRKSADRIRITVQLIEAQSGNQVWGKRYDAEIDNLFDLEEELSRSIAATVTGQIESDLQRIAIGKSAAGQQAYDLLLSSIFHCNKFNRQDMAIAIDQLNQCLALDPDNIRAHATLCFCYVMTWMERWVEDYELCFDLAGVHARKAYTMAPELGYVQLAYAEYLTVAREYDEAERQIEKTLKKNPNDANALAQKSFNQIMQGDFVNALKTAELGYELDPYHPWIEWNIAESLYHCGRYQDSLNRIVKLGNAPGFIAIYTVVANVKLGRMEQARKALELFLRNCRESMLMLPQDSEDWLRYTMNNAPFRDSAINRDIIDCLLAAGLEDELAPPRPPNDSEKHKIAVLPFDNLSGDPEQEYFSDGITESIILNLSLFPGLQVKSRNSSFAFKQQIKSLGEISGELDVDYIVEGSIRKTDERVRVTVQLVEATSGNQVWGKRYDAEIENIFDLEEELSRSIAATVTGQIETELQRVAISRRAADQQAYDLLLSGNYHLNRGNREDVVLAIDEFERCLSKDPDNARVHANLFYCHDFNVMDHWTEDVDHSRQLATEHIRRAVSLDPDLAQVQVAYANFLIFAHQFDEAERQLKRALDSNPNDTEAIAMRAVNLSTQGKAEAALEQAELALKLDPYHPWARWIRSECLYFCNRFEDCLANIADIGNPPGFIQIYRITANVRLGRLDIARTVLKEFLEFCRENMSSMPQSIGEWQQYYRDNAPFIDPEVNDHIIDCLVQTGLEEEMAPQSVPIDDDMPSIAVLPFENMSGDPEQEYFSEGITTDIISTLSKFKHMRTISRYSTLPYKTDKPPIAEIAQQQNVRYILEGSVRKSAEKIRVNAELIDATDEQILWSERYDRDLDDLFTVQDEITQNIALAMKIQFDDGEMARHRSRGATSIQAWELAMTATDLQDTYIRQNLLEARAMAKKAIMLDNEYAYAWVSLGWTYWQEAYSGWGESISDLVNQAEAANDKAFEIIPEYSEALSLAGLIHLMKHEPEKAIEACCRAVKLEPGNAEIQALTAFTYIFYGDIEQAQKYNQNMMRLCPIRANWYYLVGAQIEMMNGNANQAIEIYQQGLEVEPDSPLCRFYLINALMENGDETAARQMAEEIRTLDKDVTGKGFVHAYTFDENLRNQFKSNLEKFGLY